MRELTTERLAAALGSTRSQGEATEGPLRAVIDSRAAGPGDLFFGLPGEHEDGSCFAPGALAAGAWGAVVSESAFADAAAAAGPGQPVFAVAQPLAALGALANAWRRQLGATVIGITGSTGKTTTKDILAALAGRSRNVVATPENLNTEIGLPLVLLSAAHGTELIVLEMAMRGSGQIAELVRIAEPDVGCIVNVGPAHLEQLGSIDAVAAAKAELIAGLKPGSGAVVPAGETLLEPHLQLRDDLRLLTFGEGGDVRLVRQDRPALEISTPAGEVRIDAPFDAAHMIANLLAAVACCELAGIATGGELQVNFSTLRGEFVEVLGGVTLVNDCYNANPVSLRAALDELARADGRRIAVLGGMAELGDQSPRFHAEAGEHAAQLGLDALITVGELAAGYASGFGGAAVPVSTPAEAAEALRELARPGDTVLVKGSRSVGLELVAERLLGTAADGVEA